ncbi:MAG TPA: hypothetical protein VIL53_01395 [Solirubrobacterales bacterium]
MGRIRALPLLLGAVAGACWSPPRSTTPLGWTHSFLVLALRQHYPR